MGSYNICIGEGAGEYFTTEKFMFIVKGKDFEYKRQMSGIEEYNNTLKMLNKVINYYPVLAHQQGVKPSLEIEIGDNSTKTGHPVGFKTFKEKRK